MPLDALTTFESFRVEEDFNFWILNKQGVPSMENASAIIYGPGLDNGAEIEKALQTS